MEIYPSGLRDLHKQAPHDDCNINHLLVMEVSQQILPLITVTCGQGDPEISTIHSKILQKANPHLVTT